MIALSLTVCSILHDAGKCKQIDLIYQDVSVLTCIVAGMPEVAKWSEQHPNWIVKRWACGEAGRLANI